MIISTLPKSFTCQMNQVVLIVLMSKAKLFKVIKFTIERKTLGHNGRMVEFFVKFLHVNGMNYI
jgi:hypothetical protein